MNHLKQELKAVLFKSSNYIIDDINNKGYDGLVYVELSAPYLQQVNRHGSVKIMVRVKFWVIS